ncbi:MAG TPA: HD-GYP domain-containing protein [Solirubrobacterales bacterium]|jgi:hypothetical protein|nr:HD-GYP domain-containing protein [Solirubrobacterales bacterium]
MSVSYLGLPSTQRRQVEDARRSRLMMCRAMAGMWFIGVFVAVCLTISQRNLDGAMLAGVAVCIACAGLSLFLTNVNFSARLFAIPLIAATATYVVLAVHYGHYTTGFYLLMPGMFTTIFFWRDKLFTVAMISMFVGAFVSVPLAVGGADQLPRIIQTSPIYLALVLMVGFLGSETNQMRQQKGRFKSTISSLLVALQERDGYTADHSEETVDLAMAVGTELQITDDERSVLADVALLHDIGKIGIPNEILNKPADLDDHEWEFMKKHPEIGERIVAPVPGFAPVAKAIRHEHERWDGGGYPDGISGEEIPLSSRVVLVCDAFHAMITDRPYRKSIGLEQARHELVRHAGTQFDPAVVDALLAVIDHDAIPESVGNASFVHATNMPGDARSQADDAVKAEQAVIG